MVFGRRSVSGIGTCVDNTRVAAEGLGAISGDVHKWSWPRHLEARGPQDSMNPSPYQFCYGNSRWLPSTLGPPPSLLS